ncbi:helix-turn-helix transcriptional regulator [Temperatibacter marinus]|uniref:Helix-turn-helix transcriptional regulator n=1 Tax=Temperatibacter marinus TaxID=1456591 RepID=A0AA52EFD0_9PROT|nr:helix-turn-helix transcriptional regulator [Temperatibacter marinus]WND03705.1 helix-turn-helix transcriptional regulator [Temperatibacter marinus]
MTPFGEKMRELRAHKNVSQAIMARALDVSPAYVSALEHGKRGKPSFSFIQKVIQYFDLIWDDAEEIWDLAQISSPRVTIDTAGLSEQATRVSNRLAQKISYLSSEELEVILSVLENE